MTTQSPGHGEHNETRQALYVHERRPRWGYAVLAYDHLDKRGFQFEDGKLRVFKLGYYQMLREVDPPIDKRLPVLERLNRALGRREAAGNPKEVLIPFAEQIAHFEEQHPEGFCGDAWRKKMRGVGAKRPLKRHRDHVVQLAREQLSDEALTQLIATGQHDAVLETLIAVLEQTSLVTAAKLKPLKEAPLYRRTEIAAALRELLYGEGQLESRFKRFTTSLDCSWELATAPLALVHPEQHVCVRPSVFKQQAIWMAPQLQHTRQPDARCYRRYLKMVRAMRAQLEGAGLKPQDGLDLHDFIYLTLRPAARKALVERVKAGARKPAPVRLLDVEARESDQEAA